LFIIEWLLFIDCFGGKAHVDIISCKLITKHIVCNSNHFKNVLEGSQTVQPKVFMTRSVNTSNWGLSQKHICNIWR